jgi:hypothetical protein
MGGASSSENIPPPRHVDFCKLHPTYVAPVAISAKKLNAQNAPENDLYDEIFVADYQPHKLPTASAAVALVARAYGKVVNAQDVDSRLKQPASVREVCELLEWKEHAVLSSAVYVRYYLNLHIPVIACLRIPIDWIMGGLEKILDMEFYQDARTVQIACVFFAHDGEDLFKIAFDRDEEVTIGIVNTEVLEKFARDMCVIEVSSPRKGPKIKLAVPSSVNINA